ncbi:MAG: NlpC/P60 family protein, partial [Deltaproteobacteria bacterium]
MSRYLSSKIVFVIIIAITLITVSGCSIFEKQHRHLQPYTKTKQLVNIGYTIQSGAFSDVKNAVLLTEHLKKSKVDATYFLAKDGLFKVRFGSYKTKEIARQEAQNLLKTGVIREYYIVQPEEFSVFKRGLYGEEYLRNEIVETAKSFIGVSYLWGGESVETGFDCSGLTMTVYRLNGLNMPRTAFEQYNVGNRIDLDEIKKGDLLFFKTNRKKRNVKVTHVGIYVGDGMFI